MCPAKKTTDSASNGLRGVFAWLLGAGRPVLIVATMFGVLGGGTYVAWMKLKPSVLASPEYRIGPENVQLTPPPPWIRSDIRGEVFRSPKLDGTLSIMDDDLVERLGNGFAQHAWIAKINKVTKKFPALILVDVTYRQPVCMVEMANGLYAVDAEGIVLPSDDFSPVEATRYPRLTGVDRKPPEQHGGRWNDTRVLGGAEIAAAIFQWWEIMRLHHIAILETDASAPGEFQRRPEPIFALFTRSGSRIVWGHAPGANVAGEMPVTDKVARLKKYWDNYDSLDGPEGRPQELDVRTLRKSG